MKQGKSSRYALESLRILVVDDHEINREFLQVGLGRVVRRVVQATSGPEAIARCREQDFDVILMDLHMPHMDGLSAADSIRDLDTRSAHAQMVAMTADTRPEERRRLLNSGFDEFLNKPITIPELLQAIERLFHPGAGAPDADDQADPGSILIDSEHALAAANGDYRLTRQLQGMLAGELREKLPELDRMIAEGDFERARRQLHQWAGAAGYAGAMRLIQAARMLRHNLGEGPISSPGTAYVHFLRTAWATCHSLEH